MLLLLADGEVVNSREFLVELPKDSLLEVQRLGPTGQVLKAMPQEQQLSMEAQVPRV